MLQVGTLEIILILVFVVISILLWRIEIHFRDLCTILYMAFTGEFIEVEGDGNEVVDDN